MKIKTLSLIAGTLALALTATPFVAEAQTNTSQPRNGREMMKKGAFGQLNLTDAQKAQMKQIHERTRAKMEGVLTAEQKATLKAAMEEKKAQYQARRNGNATGNGKERWEGKGKGKRDVFASLNLTDAQKAQIKEIKQSAKAEMEAVLTPEQKAKMQELKANMRSRRQQNRQPQ